MEKELKKLISKKFRVTICGEYERTTNFIGLMRLLAQYSDFFEFSPREQLDWLKGKTYEKGRISIYIDGNITVSYRK